MQTKLVTFNVGGTRYQVSLSLLDQFPDSVLAKSASETWHKNPEEEIFIERDGKRFERVLDYMRDGRVNLSLGQTKSSLVTDLEYLGIGCDEVNIDDTEASIKSLAKMMMMKMKLIERLRRRRCCDEVAVFCINEYFNNGCNLKVHVKNDKDQKVISEFRSFLSSDRHAVMKVTNQSLHQVGLEIIDVVSSPGVFGEMMYAIDLAILDSDKEI